jgi:hypothetical protein
MFGGLVVLGALLVFGGLVRFCDAARAVADDAQSV